MSLKKVGNEDNHRERIGKGDNMKKLLIILAVFLISSLSIAKDEIRERDFKIIYRDYSFSDFENTRPASMGVMLWDNRELPIHPGLYASAALLTYRDFLRLECGGGGVHNEKKNRMEIGMLTGISILIKERIIFGVWYAPFWNTYGQNSDDPWGLMMGYAFGL